MENTWPVHCGDWVSEQCRLWQFPTGGPRGAVLACSPAGWWSVIQVCIQVDLKNQSGLPGGSSLNWTSGKGTWEASEIGCCNINLFTHWVSTEGQIRCCYINLITQWWPIGEQIWLQLLTNVNIKNTNYCIRTHLVHAVQSGPRWFCSIISHLHWDREQ